MRGGGWALGWEGGGGEQVEDDDIEAELVRLWKGGRGGNLAEGR
jgi:hypothetical protein